MIFIKIEETSKRIAELLAWIQSKIKLYNRMNYRDINITSETFFADLLNLIYNFNFLNLNKQSFNSPYVDLYDSKNNVFCQVTSEKTSKKIKETIEGVENRNDCNNSSRLIIFLLTEKPNYTTQFDTKKIKFDKNSDIIGIPDLITFINSLSDYNRINEIKNYLENSLDAVDGKEKTICSEEETIIKIIEYLSSDKTIFEETKSITDPENKINNRFKQYAAFIKNEYKELYGVYGISLNLAYDKLIDDEIKEKIHNSHLKNESIKALDTAKNNPIEALDILVISLNDLISKNGKAYDKCAIRFYLVDQIIKCNVFPNEV